MAKKICKKCGEKRLVIPILSGHSFEKQIGIVDMKLLSEMESKKFLDKLSFEPGYIDNKDGSVELVEISLCVKNDGNKKNIVK